MATDFDRGAHRVTLLHWALGLCCVIAILGGFKGPSSPPEILRAAGLDIVNTDGRVVLEIRPDPAAMGLGATVRFVGPDGAFMELSGGENFGTRVTMHDSRGRVSILPSGIGMRDVKAEGGRYAVVIGGDGFMVLDEDEGPEQERLRIGLTTGNAGSGLLLKNRNGGETLIKAE